LIIGWGHDDTTGENYWICTNSYGLDYGEDGGHFRIRRGANDFGIESEPSAFLPQPITDQSEDESVNEST
jgi:hypothetical protein